ncbi:acetyl-CoA acetyltransferase [Mycolicibacterium thermoresistibile]|uniref:Acetyl-CoA acetyltransferase n=1 Tax=Mycolicibacterium thermoresistibile TaxID=1797 RepID=A0A100XGM4_MYCTH|nr:acetyl-CoA acetyltransferase [Mycolicibacterium thermoresistibile]
MIAGHLHPCVQQLLRGQAEVVCRRRQCPVTELPHLPVRIHRGVGERMGLLTAQENQRRDGLFGDGLSDNG